jgi:rhodanese-related sulfurtransferase
MNQAPQTSVSQLQQLRASGGVYTLLDVREEWELALANLPGHVHIPLNEIPGRLKELDANSSIIVMCKSGVRSQMVADFLLAQGFSRVSNLRGGVDAWSREIDPDLPTY